MGFLNKGRSKLTTKPAGKITKAKSPAKRAAAFSASARSALLPGAGDRKITQAPVKPKAPVRKANPGKRVALSPKIGGLRKPPSPYNAVGASRKPKAPIKRVASASPTRGTPKKKPKRPGR